MALTFEKMRRQQAARKRQLTRALDSIVRQLRDMGAQEIILFGSLASGAVRRWSDLDLIAVMPPTRDGREWFREVHDRIQTDVAADILPFTRDELRRKAECSSFIRHALRTGRVVYEEG